MLSSLPPRLTFGLVDAGGEERNGVAAWAALTEWMTAHAGLTLVRRAIPTYKELAACVREGACDVAWLPPVAYAWLAEAVNPIGSIVREGRTTYAAALVVSEGSTLRELGDLRAVRAGWVDPWSAAGYVVPRLELARARVDPSAAFATETFYGSHRDALLALGRGECDVVGTYATKPLDEDESGVAGAWTAMEGLRVRVLTTFGAIPTDVLATRRNLAPADHERAANAFRKACSEPAGQALVRAVFGGDELREGVAAGHEALRLEYERAIANGLFD